MSTRSFRLLLLVPALLAGTVAVRAAEQPRLRLGAKWKAGEKRRLTLVHSLERVEGGQLFGRSRITRQVELEVLEASLTGFLVRWTFTSAATDEPPGETPIEHWTLLLRGLSLEVEADRAGDFNRIRNWQQVAAAAEKASEALLSEKPALEPGRKEEIRKHIRAVFSSKANVEAFYAREIRLYTFVLGWYLRPGERESYPDYLANPLGGEPFPAKATLELKSYDPASGRAVLRWWQNLNPAETRRILLKSAADEADRTGKAPPAPEEIPVFHIGDTADIVLNNTTGWVETLRNRRLVTTRRAGVEVRDVRTLEISSRAP